jgi:hypothetical protein
VTLCALEIVEKQSLYREVLTFVDKFKELRFMVSGASSGKRRIRMLSINQYA